MTLSTRIFAAFALRPRPKGVHIVRPESGAGSGRVTEVLEDRLVSDVSVPDINGVLEGNLWMLTPEAFLYYLPAFMHITLTKYDSVSVFASELVGALTEPKRLDIVESLERFGAFQPGLVEPRDQAADLLRDQQLEWFDSGIPTAIFNERFGDLPAAEGRAILAFLEAFRESHAEMFPFGELDAAINRRWASFRPNG
jgi:hypothetical protein